MKIHYLNGEFAGRKVEIPSAGAAIGRESDNDIQLLVGGVSRYHAKLESQNGVWYLRDLGSTNGTKYNGDPVMQPVKLQDGDVFSVGDQIFRVEGIGHSAPPPPEPVTPEPVTPEPVTPEPAPSAPAADGGEPAFVFRMPSPDDAAPEVIQPEKTAKVMTPEQNAGASGMQNFSLGNLFGKDGKSESSSAAGDSAGTQDAKRRMRNNFLFYILVVMVAVLCVVLFWRTQNAGTGMPAEGAAARPQVRGNPFFLFYEKQTVTKSNAVFRFSFLLENGHVSFSLDDLQSGRVYAPVIPDPVRPEAIEKLKKTILETNFMSSVQQEKAEDTADGLRNYARITTGFDDKFNDITVRDIVLSSFTRVEEAISSFLYEEFGLDSSMVESRDTLIRQARSAFDLAEKQYNSIRTQPANLWRAIENYRISMRRYEVFAEKPPEWTVARARLAEAEAKLEAIRKEGHHTVNMYYQQREYDKALQECTRLLEYFPPDSEAYGKIREFKIQIEKIMKGGK